MSRGVDSHGRCAWRCPNGLLTVRARIAGCPVVLLRWLPPLSVTMSSNAAGGLIAGRYSVRRCLIFLGVFIFSCLQVLSLFNSWSKNYIKKIVCSPKIDLYITWASYWLVNPGCAVVSTVFNFGTNLAVTCWFDGLWSWGRFCYLCPDLLYLWPYS